MTDIPLDQREREELCDLFLNLGPDAPTLCEGWTTLDLAAHLAVREREPRASTGLVISRFAPYLQRRQDAWADKGLEACVEKLRGGPPPVPWRIPGVRNFLNLNEWAIHHEDVRRANGMTRRTDRPDLEDAIWGMLKRGAAFSARKLEGAGLDLVRPEGERATARKGEPKAELRGYPLELLLYLSGRKANAEVEVTGPEAAVTAVSGAPFGL